VLIIPYAWGSQLPGYNHHHQLYTSHQIFSGAVAGEEKEDFCEENFSHAHPLLCFIVLLYFIYFTCIVLYQKHKKI
jgi:hypothetical protein